MCELSQVCAGAQMSTAALACSGNGCWALKVGLMGVQKGAEDALFQLHLYCTPNPFTVTPGCMDFHFRSAL